MVEKRLTRRKSHRHAESRKEIVYQTLDDAAYEPPGYISARSGEKKTITKPESSCRLTKITIACTHVDDAEDEGPKKSSGEKKGEESDHTVSLDPKLYEKCPISVVAPLTWGVAKQLAQKTLPGTGATSKWLREDVLMAETITVTVEGYFCEKDHPKITVKEVGRKNKKSDTVADVGKDETDVKLFNGPAPKKDDKKGSKKKEAKKDSSKKSSEKKDKSSSQPVMTTTEKWFYVGSLMPKFKSAFFVPNYLYPRYVSPNVYEIHIETCSDKRVIYIEAFYEAQYKIEFGRNPVHESGDDPNLNWNPFESNTESGEEEVWNPFSEHNSSFKKLGEELKCWNETFAACKSGSFWNILYQLSQVFMQLLKNYKLTLKQDGPGFRVNPEISSEAFEKFVKIITAFTELRKNLEKRKADGHTNLEFNVGHDLKLKLMEGSIESNWRHREHGGRRVGWYHDIQVNMTLIEAEYSIGFNWSPSWTGHLQIKGAGKVALSAVAKGKLSSDLRDMVVAGWQNPKSNKLLTWMQSKTLKKQAGPDDIDYDDELSKDIREGIPIDLECKPEVSFEIPVFMEELFNLSPKAEGGLEGGGFIGFDSDGPCIRMGLNLKDIGVSIEISALGGWISFTVGPVPIIKTEDWGKSMGKWIDNKYGDIACFEEGQFRFPAPPDWKKKADASKAAAKVKAKVKTA